jgi:hypothetical protein
MFCFEQELSGETVRLIVDSCQQLKKLKLDSDCLCDEDDAIHIIETVGKQLTTLALPGDLTDAAYLYLNKCVR